MIVDFFTFLGGIVEFFLTMFFYIVLFVAITTACIFIWIRYKLTGKGFWTSWSTRRGSRPDAPHGNTSGYGPTRDTRQQQSGQGGRIFKDNEGEYIDFEEVE